MTNCGEHIRYLRKKKRITQRQLADGIGVSSMVISLWESNKSIPNGEVLKKLSELLGTTEENLLKATIDEEPEMAKGEISIARQLFSLRVEANLTQAKLAESIGVCSSVISEWEHGNRTPTLENLVALSRFYKRRLDYVIGISKDNRYYDYDMEEI